MNILVLHNDNVPKYLSSSSNDGEFNIIAVPLYPHWQDGRIYDTFVSEEITKILSDIKESLDLVILPYTLNMENYMEFTGLRVAAHIRLTPQWEIEHIPILFIGPESDHLIDVMKYSELGDILNSYNIFNTSRKTEKELKKMFVWINNHINKEQDDFKDKEIDLLNRLKKISAPSNYSSRHSIANEWAIHRWVDMFKWGDIEKPKSINTDFSNMLYFKYLVAESNIRMLRWKKKDKKSLGESEFAGKRIMYIDDEANKGWQDLLSAIFTKSSAELVTYSFDNAKGQCKEDLINDIETFIETDYNKYGGVDCYLLDLRLHEDDFLEGTNYEELSGHKIASYIKYLNQGNQIVIFSASNKIWNIQEAQEKYQASGYVIKESPEQHYTNENTSLLYSDFIKKLRHACSLSYLKEIYKSLKLFDDINKEDKEKISLLYSYPELVALDNDKKNNVMIKACAMTLITFLESFIKDRFELDGLKLKRGDYLKSYANRILFEKDEDNIIKRVYCYAPDKKADVHLDLEAIDPKKNGELPLILVALYLYYGMDESNINLVTKIKRERNISIAHNNRHTILTMNELYKFFSQVIIPMLKKEYKIA